MAEPETKHLSLELKTDGPDGAFTATFATLNVVDHHGDVTVPGAFEAGKSVLVGAYQHEMFQLPVGKGTIQADENRAWIDGTFNLKTTLGRDTYETVKDARGLMEWSYIFQVTESADGEFDPGNGTKIPVRYLKKLDVWSVDPVLKGAGIGTRTDSIKALNREMPFAEHAEEITAALDAFGERVKRFADFRAKEGRTLSSANVDRLGSIAESLKAAAADLEKLLADANPPKTIIDMGHEFLRFQRTLALLQGVPA